MNRAIRLKIDENQTLGKVFVSHAVRDKKLVEALIDLLQMGCDLRSGQIFASSVEGMRIPQGQAFVDYIREQLVNAALVVEVITPSYWSSPFCLCELGGQWALELDVFPLIVPPQEFADLKAVLQIRQAAMISRPEDLDDLRDRIIDRFGVTVATARWNAKRDVFLNAQLPKLLSELAKPEQVPAARLAQLQDQLHETEIMLAEKEEQFSSLQAKYDALVETKTREEALEIARPGNEFEQMEQLQSAVLKAFRDLPRVVREAIFEEVTERSMGEGWLPDESDRLAADEQVRQGLLVEHSHGDGLVPNEDEPSIERAVKAARELCLWEPSFEFEEAFKREHDTSWAPKNRKLWSELGLIGMW